MMNGLEKIKKKRNKNIVQLDVWKQKGSKCY